VKQFRLPTVRQEEEEIKQIQIITDQTDVVQKTTAMHGAPDPQECARSLQELDDASMSVEIIDALVKHAVPDEQQFEQLKALREKYPTVPMAPPERFMWVFGQIPKAQHRLEVWYFVRTISEAVNLHSTRIKDFETICDSITSSQALREFFGHVLAIGNYMNGGTNRGQYDGFYIDKTLEAVSNCKDKNKDNLAHFVLKHFAETEPDEFNNLVDDIQPAVLNISRRVKQKEGADIINRNPKVNIEDYEPIVNGLKATTQQMKGFVQEILKEVQDDSDPFKLRMPSLFGDAEKSVNALVKLRDETKTKYQEVLKYLALDKNLQADKFCMIWDRFFVPEARLLSARFEGPLRSKFIIPNFCSDKPFTGQHLQILWGFEEWQEEEKEEKQRRGGDGKKGGHLQNRRKEKPRATAASIHDDVEKASDKRRASRGEKRRESRKHRR